MVFAAYLKLLMPVIIVLPGIAAVMLAPGLARPDEAYPTMMRLLPAGMLGLVFAALIAAIVASTASKINSDRDDLHARHLRQDRRSRKSEDAAGDSVGRIAAVVAILLAILTARPLLGSFDQAFQYIQEFTGFFTPGIVVIFLLGLFWKRATEAGALAAAIGSFALSVAIKALWPELPFMDRMGLVFLLALRARGRVLAALAPAAAVANRIQTAGVGFRTSAGFNIGAVGVIVILIALYTAWW